MPPRRVAATLLVYRIGPKGPVLVRAEFGRPDQCPACHGSKRYRASGKACPVTIECPWCRRRRR